MTRGQEFAGRSARRGRSGGWSARAGVSLAPPPPGGGRGRRVGRPRRRWIAPSSREPRLPPGVLRAVRVLLEPGQLVALDGALLMKRVRSAVGHRRSDHRCATRVPESRCCGGRPNGRREASARCPCRSSIGRVQGRQRHARPFVSGAVRSSKRRASFAGARETRRRRRFGGDEFADRAPRHGGEGAFAVGERIRDQAAHPFLSRDGLDIRLTASVGLATLPDSGRLGRRVDGGRRQGDVRGERFGQERYSGRTRSSR